MKVRKTMLLYDLKTNTYTEVHNAYINGEMSNGCHTWTFDEADETGLYLAFRDLDNKLYLCRQ